MVNLILCLNFNFLSPFYIHDLRNQINLFVQDYFERQLAKLLIFQKHSYVRKQIQVMIDHTKQDL